MLQSRDRQSAELVAPETWVVECTPNRASMVAFLAQAVQLAAPAAALKVFRGQA